MKTSAWISGVARLGCVVALQGCGAGTYHIPNVEPVVKQKPEDDLLDDIENGDSKKTDSASSSSSSGSSDSEKPGDAPADAGKPTDAKGAKAGGSSKK